jgi:hypothetical protein
MKLYHYSKDLYSRLESRLFRSVSDKKELEEQITWNKEVNGPGIYDASISLFIDPVPLSLLGRLFGEGHHTWFNGNELYEYVIDVDSLGNDFIYNIVETPSDVKLLDETDWVDTDEFFIEYKNKLNTIKRSTGEIGSTLSGLKHQLAKYKGMTKDFYIIARKRSDAEEHFNKYAANVPHVMLYPKKGIINIESVNMVIVGSEIRKPVKISQESIIVPPCFKW